MNYFIETKYRIVLSDVSFVRDWKRDTFHRAAARRCVHTGVFGAFDERPAINMPRTCIVCFSIFIFSQKSSERSHAYHVLADSRPSAYDVSTTARRKKISRRKMALNSILHTRCRLVSEGYFWCVRKLDIIERTVLSFRRDFDLFVVLSHVACSR